MAACLQPLNIFLVGISEKPVVGAIPAAGTGSTIAYFYAFLKKSFKYLEHNFALIYLKLGVS